MKFSVINLGCKVNRVESDAAAALLLSRGGQEAFGKEADIVVVNTCTVTGEAEKKARKAVRRALRDHPCARIVVTGCAAALDSAAYRALDSRVDVVAKGAIDAYLSEQASRLCESEAGREQDASTPSDRPLPAPVGGSFRTRVGVKVQDGCDNACTFCIVHVARGQATSRSADEVSNECATLARSGVREIVLTGINLGSYCDGDRRDPQAVRLSDLVSRLLRETDGLGGREDVPTRFRISSIEPRDVDERLVSLLAEGEGRLCRHLHLPLQSGSDKVLREMARPYDVGRYIALVDRLREAIPTISLSTDIIVGFPGETDAEFQQTLAVARHCGFSKIHVFPYSVRAGTPAAQRTDQVPMAVRAQRAAAARALGDELRAADYARRVGMHELVLVEAGNTAMTESYFEIPAPRGSAPGALVDALLPPVPDVSEGLCALSGKAERNDGLCESAAQAATL